MIITVHRHPGTGTGPAGLRLALAVAPTLSAPAARAPEVAPATAPRRAARGRRAAVRG
ncbi:hypothetical protein [Streptomyces sp. NPDC088785]|uniref:hypothetical protein n=1 Tax=Streptomyces sp. NPDC088785 TaxID=3365897 RepID=UPI00380EA0AE